MARKSKDLCVEEGEWHHVLASLDGNIRSNPRETKKYRDAVVGELKLNDPKACFLTNESDIAVTGAIWVTDLVRVIAGGLVHDVIMVENGVRIL